MPCLSSLYIEKVVFNVASYISLQAFLTPPTSIVVQHIPTLNAQTIVAHQQ